MVHVDPDAPGRSRTAGGGALPLHSPEGQAALTALARQRPLLAFDFDGTLAPIVDRPDDARMPAATAQRLQALMQHVPLAIVTGRRIADARRCLGFEPHHLLGNHGAEDPAAPGSTRGHAPHADAGYRQAWVCIEQAQAALTAAGVRIEDKGASLALHYRQAPDPAAARAAIDALLAKLGDQARTYGGKMVMNISPAHAPDKADAVHTLLARTGAPTALFAGDDVNDEPVFQRAPPEWLTLRVGHAVPDSRARWCIDGPMQMPWVLDQLLKALTSG